MFHNAKAGAMSRQVSDRFLRQLVLSLFGGLLLMAATFSSTWWMAAQQDEAARSASRRMVTGGIEAFVEATKKMLLDYAIWTDAYDNIRAGDLAWMYSNIGSSADIGTFDLAVILAPGRAPVGWRIGGGEAPASAADLLEPAALAAANAQLDGVPLDEGTAGVTYVRSVGQLWLLTIARVVPQDGPPEGATDAELPRLVFGYRMSTETLDAIRRRFQIEDLAVAPERVPGHDALSIRDAGGAPLAVVAWRAPTPGRVVLEAALVPLTALMLLVGSVAVVVSRELVRSARRLESALEQANLADRIKTEFLSNVSHELRTPLNGVIGIAQLLKMREPDAEARAMLDTLLSSAHCQLGLINRLLDVTLIESGAMKLDRSPFDPAEALDETVRMIAPEVARKGLALRVAVAPEATRSVIGDPLAFRQIVTNLVGNALKFTDRGEIAVDLAVGEQGELTLVVADTGAGIDPSQHRRIFERFVQVDGSPTRREGAGLGLPITRALAELMGGDIRVESALGSGATFVATLPLPAEPAGRLAADCSVAAAAA